MPEEQACELYVVSSDVLFSFSCACLDFGRFCKICFLYEKVSCGPHKGRTKFFHAQWLQHGSQTLLQESSHSRALFWLNECEDLPLECIYSHCNLVPWPSKEVEPLEDIGGQENLFFTGYQFLLTYQTIHDAHSDLL